LKKRLQRKKKKERLKQEKLALEKGEQIPKKEPEPVASEPAPK
jgi:hypothetical protein